MKTDDDALIELTKAYNELLSEYNQALFIMDYYCPAEITNTFIHYYEMVENEK